MMHKHLFVDAVNTLYTSLYNRRLDEFLISETVCDSFFYGIYKSFTFVLLDFKNMLYFRICKRIKVME